ncbi:hypothetical protein Poli38472_006641 [Pythium oligandrum]|uniref:DNA repair and recombination protein RAD54 n=1 Tax=Pythium oligandrum TaxID=41045 RepID=A0A8K1C4Y7_PYTOL|nr:hypothetical protein Poli38472_006641 [Pythium oligandrum]|eukprot:TMW56631.1 hypothetical protein Poli38472_006641 [Pythium oligandrum]
MSLLRRRVPSGGAHGGGSAPFKPFVLPLKKKPAEDENENRRKTSTADNRQMLETGEAMTIKRLPILSFFTVPTEEREVKLRQPFKSPCEGNRTGESRRLLQVKTLGMRRRWSGNVMKPLVKHDLPPVTLEDVDDDPLAGMEKQHPNVTEEVAKTPPAVENAPPPLVLWQDEENPALQVIVPEIVGKFLRPHQREGVQFMFDCVAQIRGFDGQGCILADDMGLGKTLQSITLMYTLLKCSMTIDRTPMIRRAIVVCPTSLVKNWDDEIIKWLHGRVKTIALFEANRDTVIKGIRQFVEGSKPTCSGLQAANAAQVLIISYETFRMHAQRFADAPSCCDLLICDEAHRLKNANSQINRALSSLACRKRVLLSGTPMQNDLEEFYAMVDFTNPNILGSTSEFRKEYLNPILVGREPDSTDRDREKAQSCSAMLCEIVNQFILRRGNILNAKHLPPKLMQVVCCPLSPLQDELYTHFLESSAFRNMMKKESANVLSSITALKKLCNHPLLIFDESGKSNTKLAGFEGCAKFFEAAKLGDNIGGSGSSSMRRAGGGRTCHPEWSGKMLLLDRLMQQMRKRTSDRIVIVSNYTQTLDVVSSLCHERRLPFVRLDGTTSAKKRKKLVDTFNDPTTNSFAFLLSSKAGGCGLNLIGANRLVLFDPDWNPATDKQAAARVWREGQKKMCYVYRFLATGTLEEKIFQRQLSKEGLQNIVDDKEEVNSLSSKDLKRLFILRRDTLSDTHDQLKCERCQWRNPGEECDHEIIEVDQDGTDDSKGSSDGELPPEKHYHPQIGMPPEEDLNSWGHHRAYDSVDDEVMQHAIADLREALVSFAFSCRVDWQLLQDYHMGNEAEESEREEERKRKRLEKIAAAKQRNEDANTRATTKPKKKKHVDSEEESGQSDSDEDDFASSSDDSEDEKENVPDFSHVDDDHAGETEEEVVVNSESDSEVEVFEPPPRQMASTLSLIAPVIENSPVKRALPTADAAAVTEPSQKKPRILKAINNDSDESDWEDAIFSKPPSPPAPATQRPSYASSVIIDEDSKESEPPGHEAESSEAVGYATGAPDSSEHPSPTGMNRCYLADRHGFFLGEGLPQRLGLVGDNTVNSAIFRALEDLP